MFPLSLKKWQCTAVEVVDVTVMVEVEVGVVEVAVVVTVAMMPMVVVVVVAGSAGKARYLCSAWRAGGSFVRFRVTLESAIIDIVFGHEYTSIGFQLRVG